MSKLVKKASEHARRKQGLQNTHTLKRVTTPLTHESLNRAIGFMVITAVLVAVSLILVVLG